MMINKFIYQAFAIIILLASCEAKKEKKENVVQVKYHKVRVKEFQFPKRTSGILSTSDEFKMSFKTGGIIQKIHVNEGDKVLRGSLMAVLELSEIEANVEQAKAALAKAERDYKRTNNLYRDSVATKEQLQNAQTALDVAASRLKIATFNLQHSKISAPSDGTVLNILKEENELVSPGYPVIVFGSTTNNWILKVNVTDKDLVEIEVGDSASVSFDAHPSEIFSGRLTTISKGADPYTNTYKVEIELDRTDEYLASGFIGHANIFPKNSESYPVIPYDGLLHGDELTGTVAVLQSDTSYEIRNIDIKMLLDEGIVVAQGLQKNDKIITEGVNYIDDDTKIKIIE